MNTIKDIFRIGHGPSSSHTMGPVNAVNYILKKYSNISSIDVILKGSLAYTGKGHFTDIVIDSLLKNIDHNVVFDTSSKVSYPNTLSINIKTKDNKLFEETFYSIGGGTVLNEDGNRLDKTTIKNIYPHNTLTEILEFCKTNNLTLAQYIRKFEDSDIDSFIETIYAKMMDVVNSGLQKEGRLPGSLNVERKAKAMYQQFNDGANKLMLMAIAAYSAAEENAAAEEVVTAPTCGSSGVIPGILYYLNYKNYPHDQIINGLLVAGLIGQLCKTNGSISGAEAGCQAEIGVACSMGAALIAAAKNQDNYKIERCAEIALEHSLGLTCDPVKGYVIIPCIERNAMYALKARDAVSIAKLLPSSSALVSFDTSVKTMLMTGKDLKEGYRETSTKGLATQIK